MLPAAMGICHVDPTHARHAGAADFIWGLVIDLDLLRIGHPPVSPVTPERLDRWAKVSAPVRSCWEARFLKGGHDAELDHCDALVARVRADLAAGRTPSLPDGGVPEFLAARHRMERCRDQNLKH